jgi:hypothetical protein
MSLCRAATAARLLPLSLGLGLQLLQVSLARSEEGRKEGKSRDKLEFTRTDYSLEGLTEPRTVSHFLQP